MSRRSRRPGASLGLSVGELAEGLGVTVRSLRHYEAVGLLKPRRISNRRLYDTVQQGRAHAIAELRALGVSLQDIDRALDDTSSEDERRFALVALLAKSLEEIDARAWRTQTVLAALRAGEALTAIRRLPSAQANCDTNPYLANSGV